ncbi:hypothetical protein JK361_09845 [Streptomyces sp. 5-8]|uniref:Lipoprotein n=1 Tax=Streptomyces musisoli TaxID=2802280 RepID=A0ABS1NXQ6_9ACTN|nr:MULTISPECIES: hypothetical protein [Streptomyces]MBL1104892.1 hypothetical protein [Streptomyces musisoli]MBY8841035.1 hypothetical protein [Streptomyces sp. SP2-10]
MGAWRGIRRGPRAVAVAGLVVLAGGAAVACQPGGLGSATVAYTTDQTATTALERRHVDVNWLTCTGVYGDDDGGGKAPSPAETTVVSVDCRGETDDGRKIVVTGLVTKAVDGACVRGDLKATVAGRQVFHVGGLGDCAAKPGPTYHLPTGGQPKPTVTVTVTRTVWPVPGK